MTGALASTASPVPRVVWRGPWLWVVPVVCAAGAAAVLLTGADRALFPALNALCAGPAWVRDVWRHVTSLGYAEVAFGLTSPLLLRRHPALLLAAVLAAVLGLVASAAIKDLADRDRPVRVLGRQNVHVAGEVLHSDAFPSGHTNAAFIVAGLLALTARHRRTRFNWLAAGAVVGLSRVVVGAHWPSDVLAGAALGWAVAAVAWRLALAWQPRVGRRTRAVLLTVLLLLVLNAWRRAAGSDALLLNALAGGVGLAVLLPMWVRTVFDGAHPPPPGTP